MARCGSDRPLKNIDAAAEALLKLLQRWSDEAHKAGRTIKRIVGAYEAGQEAGASAAGTCKGFGYRHRNR